MKSRLQVILYCALLWGDWFSSAQAQEGKQPASTSVKVMLMFYESPADIASRTSPKAKAYWDSWARYGKAMTDAGIVRGGHVMTPGEAKTVRVVANKNKSENKAYLDKKGELGGFFIIETSSVESAEEWAAKAPNATSGVVELRVLPFMPSM